MHVLHVLNSAHGGSAISTFELIGALKERGVKSSLVCFNNASPDQLKSIGNLVEGRVLFVPLYWMNKKIRATWWKRPVLEALSLWRTWGGHKYQHKISALIKKEGVTIVHTSTILNPEGAIAAKLNKLFHVWHVRELIGPSKYFQFNNYRRISRYVLSHSHIILANSTVTKECLKSYLPAEKILVIPNSVDVSKFSIKEHTNGEGKLVVAMIGNVTSRLKNHKFFVEVAEKLSHYSCVRFRIYGTLPSEGDYYYSSLRDMIKRSGLIGKLAFVDFKENPAEIMREIDILFHPAANESFGRIFIEAMASAIPVVGINEGGSKEMIKEEVNGFLIPMNVTEGASKVEKLINNPQLRTRMGLEGRKLVETEYTIDRMTDRIMHVYKNIQK